MLHSLDKGTTIHSSILLPTSLPTSIQNHSISYSYTTPAVLGPTRPPSTWVTLWKDGGKTDAHRGCWGPGGRMVPHLRGSSGVGWVRPQKSEGGNTVLSLFLHDFPHSSLSFPGLPPPRFSPSFRVYPMTWSLPNLALPLPTSS